MKYIVSINFDNYNHEINVDKMGVITLTLKPKFYDNILLKDSKKLKKGSTIFKRRYCTLYKKSDNEYFYRFTLWKPGEFTYSKEENKKIVDFFECEIATEDYKPYFDSKFKRRLNRYKKKAEKYDNIYLKFYHKNFN